MNRGKNTRTPGGASVFGNMSSSSSSPGASGFKPPAGTTHKLHGVPTEKPGAVGMNPFAPQIENIKRLLVIMNPRSGWRTAPDTFAQSVSEVLDRTGVVHKIHQCPPETIEGVLRDEGKMYPKWEAVLIAGGDGTVNSYCYNLTLPEFAEWRPKPIGILPCGANNGLANSIGVGVVNCTTASLISGRTIDVPVYRCSLIDPPTSSSSSSQPKTEVLSACLGGINIGFFCETLMTASWLREYMQGFVALPTPRRRNFWSTLYHAWNLKRSNVKMSVRYTDAETGLVKGLDEKEFSMFYASQTVFHHKGYSLTPHAEIGKPMIDPIRPATIHPKLAITTVTPDVERSRMLHLFLKEAPLAGHQMNNAAGGVLTGIEQEDGVKMFEAESIELCLERRGEHSTEKKRTFLLDGEECEIQPGQTLRVAPTTLALKFMVP